MNQLDKRVSKLEHIMGKRPPRLDGMTCEEVLELLCAHISDPARVDLIISAMSDHRLEESFAAITEELAARGCSPILQEQIARKEAVR